VSVLKPGWPPELNLTGLGTDFRVLAITTPEGVRFDLPLAGPTTRFLAWFMDALVIYGAVGLCSQGLGHVSALNEDLVHAVYVILIFGLTIGYPIALEWLWRGQTVGKRIFGLRVIDASGRRLSFGQIALRNILRLVDALPLLYLVGGAALVLSTRCQRLGDMLASTVVLRQKQLMLPAIPPSSDAQIFNSLCDHPHLAARLRQTVPTKLVQIALEAVIRRDQLAPPARIAVFRALAERFKVYATLPDDTLAWLSDERYVRNCLEVVLNHGNLRRHVSQFNTTNRSTQ
jgi:uncharacterized RDD family membrane protein YckC